MSLTAAQWMEVAFNLAYLAVIYGLVGAMWARRPVVDEAAAARRCRLGFSLLALGDTGHVGFRVVAYFLGGLDARVDVAGQALPLVGAGALSTAITVTVLYALLLDAWRVRFAKPTGALYLTLAALAVLRLVLFLPDGNAWGSPVPPWGWSLVRNAPLALLGLGVAALFVRDGRRAGHHTFVRLGWLVVGSFAFYLPVILFVQRAPAVGMLMVPKTLMYVAMAWLVVHRLFLPKAGAGAGAT